MTYLPNFYKFIYSAIIKHVVLIINRSLATEIYPDKFKSNPFLNKIGKHNILSNSHLLSQLTSGHTYAIVWIILYAHNIYHHSILYVTPYSLKIGHY